MRACLRHPGMRRQEPEKWGRLSLWLCCRRCWFLAATSGKNGRDSYTPPSGLHPKIKSPRSRHRNPSKVLPLPSGAPTPLSLPSLPSVSASFQSLDGSELSPTSGLTLASSSSHPSSGPAACQPSGLRSRRGFLWPPHLNSLSPQTNHITFFISLLTIVTIWDYVLERGVWSV